MSPASHQNQILLHLKSASGLGAVSQNPALESRGRQAGYQQSEDRQAYYPELGLDRVSTRLNADALSQPAHEPRVAALMFSRETFTARLSADEKSVYLQRSQELITVVATTRGVVISAISLDCEREVCLAKLGRLHSNSKLALAAACGIERGQFDALAHDHQSDLLRSALLDRLGDADCCLKVAAVLADDASIDPAQRAVLHGLLALAASNIKELRELAALSLQREAQAKADAAAAQGVHECSTITEESEAKRHKQPEARLVIDPNLGERKELDLKQSLRLALEIAEAGRHPLNRTAIRKIQSEMLLAGAHAGEAASQAQQARGLETAMRYRGEEGVAQVESRAALYEGLQRCCQWALQELENRLQRVQAQASLEVVVVTA